MTTRLALALCSAMALAGCDDGRSYLTSLSDRFIRVLDVAEQPTIEFDGGYAVMNEGQKYLMFGTAPCPEDKTFLQWITGQPGVKTPAVCVAIPPETKTVSVTLIAHGIVENEDLAVNWDMGPGFRLQRQDGTYLYPALEGSKFKEAEHARNN